LSNKMIRNLGSEFCKISPEVLSEVALRKKPLPKKAVAPVGMQSDKANNKSKKNNDDKPPKKRRKN
jgi:selenophosphate synthase